MEALVKLSESLPEGLSEIQKENLEELVEVLEHIERSGQQIIPALLSTRLGVDGARIRQNVGTDDLAPEDIEPGDIYVPGETIAKSGDGVVVVPLFGVKGNLRWLMGDRLPDCFSHNATNNGVTGSACADCPDLPFRDGEMTDCALVWHWVFLTEDCSKLFYVMFRGKSAKTGSNLNRLVRRPGTRKVRLFTESEKNKKGSYYVWKSSMLGDRPDSALKKLSIELSNLMIAKYDAIIEEDEQAGGGYDASKDTSPVMDVEAPAEDIQDM
jgi:hypothetical protein